MPPVLSILVSARPELTERAAREAREWSEVIVHQDTGDFLGSLREAFPDRPAIKVDDDDTYPTDHGRIMRFYRGQVVWNMVNRFGCDGRRLGWRAVLSGGVIPPGMFDHAELDEAGRVEPWVRAHYVGEMVWTGTRATVCPARWLWHDHPTWLDFIDCRHGDR